jgi:hypothetical protein
MGDRTAQKLIVIFLKLVVFEKPIHVLLSDAPITCHSNDVEFLKSVGHSIGNELVVDPDVVMNED